ncbi:aminotransferase class I/II-fold pyridoxal phosphate-dependent enzyme [Fibrella aquatilis]|uniref:Pyridoxal phosphate-dependent aminotransferase family protein n=1 Tax=Fibrella aquatilis TaxID=2817059 RepID=A0A939JWR3_9BACT|nr:aminotransferase class I/II-fold pyridoxal phosphate-dependent enzyme [Fibrella aquatilis]MBO0932182.1 pyridoxal phosphate-dependent aminotransferase family protein [Fibrella aquatilis]
MIINQLPNRTITYEGRDYLFFSGTAYLGLARRPAMQALLAEGVGQYGLHFGASRNGNLQLAIFEAAETKLAGQVGAPAALTVSSGMLAGQVVADWLAHQVEPNAVGIQAPGTHPALWHPLIKPQTVDLHGHQSLPMNLAPAYILTNSVDAIRSGLYSFDWINQLSDNQMIWLIVDDSHGLGVLNGGRGIWPQLALKLAAKPNVRLLVTGSLAKAMSLPGGVIFGDLDTLVAIRQTAYFGACSPMPPAYAYAYVHADALYAEGYERLMRNVALAEAALLPTGLFSHAPGYPVFYTDHDDLYPFLLENGIFVYSFAYPTPADKANTRIVISAFHEPQDIHNLAVAVRRFAQQHTRYSPAHA